MLQKLGMLYLLILSAVHQLPHLKIIPKSILSDPIRNFSATVDYVNRVLSEPLPLQYYPSDIDPLTNATPSPHLIPILFSYPFISIFLLTSVTQVLSFIILETCFVI